MFHTPGRCFVAKLSVGREVGLFLLSPANSNESRNEFEPVGSVAARLVERLKEKAGSPRGLGGNPQAPGKAGQSSPDCQHGAHRLGREPARHRNS